MKENEFGRNKQGTGSDYAKIRGYSLEGSHKVSRRCSLGRQKRHRVQSTCIKNRSTDHKRSVKQVTVYKSASFESGIIVGYTIT